ncbi:MAG: hypothetical protein QW103_02205 [Candidatus Pacearchaeota archaeon]
MELYVIFLFIFFCAVLRNTKNDFLSKFVSTLIQGILGMFILTTGITTKYTLLLQPLAEEIVLIEPNSLNSIILFLTITMTSFAQMIVLAGRKK